MITYDRVISTFESRGLLKEIDRNNIVSYCVDCNGNYYLFIHVEAKKYPNRIFSKKVFLGFEVTPEVFEVAHASKQVQSEKLKSLAFKGNFIALDEKLAERILDEKKLNKPNKRDYEMEKRLFENNYAQNFYKKYEELFQEGIMREIFSTENYSFCAVANYQYKIFLKNVINNSDKRMYYESYTVKPEMLKNFEPTEECLNEIIQKIKSLDPVSIALANYPVFTKNQWSLKQRMQEVAEGKRKSDINLDFEKEVLAKLQRLSAGSDG